MNPQQNYGIDFTPVSANQVPSGIDFTPQTSPDQAAQASGHATGLMSQILGGAGAVGNVALGFGKSALHTGMELGKLTAEAGSQLPGQAGQFFQQKLQAGTQEMQKPQFQPQGAAQQAGFMAGDIAQYFSPGGLEKGALKAAAPFIEKAPEIAGLTGKAASITKGALGIGAQAGTTAASMGAVTAAETGDVQQGIGAAQTGALAGGFGGALEAIAPGALQVLAKSGFKMNDATAAKSDRIATAASQFMANNKIVGTDRTKVSKLSAITQNFEKILQSSLPDTTLVPKSEVLSQINQNLAKLKSEDEAVYKQAQSVIKEATGLINSKPGSGFTLKDALANKRSWGNRAFKTSQASKRDPMVASEGAFIVEKAYQDALGKTMEQTGASINIPPEYQKFFGGQSSMSVSDFNKVYSQAINARNLMNVAQFKSDSGLFGRLFGIAIGEVAGQAIMPGPIGKMAGMAGGEIGSNKLFPAARYVAEQGLTHPGFPAVAAKTIQGAENPSLQNPDNQQSAGQ